MAQSKKQFTSPFLAGDRHGHLSKDRMHKKRRRRHSTAAEPAMTRQGALAHPGTLLMGAAAVLFLAYVSNFVDIRTSLDGFFAGLDHKAHAHTVDVTSLYLSLLPLVGLLLTAFLLWLVFSNLGTGAKKSRAAKAGGRDSGPELTIHQFAAEAQAYGVGVEVAREVYRMLQPAYKDRMRAVLHQSLSRELRKDPMDIEDLYRRMLHAADCRQVRAGSHGEADTLMQLMQCLQRQKYGKLLESSGDATEPAAPAAAPGKRPKGHSWIRPAQLAVPEQPRVISLTNGR